MRIIHRWRSCRVIAIDFASSDGEPGQCKQIFQPISVRVFYDAFFDWLKKSLLHPNFQRLAKLLIFGGFSLSKKVDLFINATFLLNTLFQKMSNFSKRPI